MRVAGQIATVLLLTAALGGGYLGYQHYLAPPQPHGPTQGQQRAQPLKVEAVVASQKSMARRIEAVGSTRARQSVEIVPMASGRITAINFTSGQRVARGDVLIKLDDDIERANLVEADAKFKQAKLAVDRATRSGARTSRPWPRSKRCSRSRPEPKPRSNGRAASSPTGSSRRPSTGSSACAGPISGRVSTRRR
jgi:multidrug efflux pump subunit AcrA (membrane-fusion protein)